MAYSILTCADRVQSFNDLDLIVLLGLLHRRIQGEELPQLEVAVKELRHFGPGTIDMDLDGIVTMGLSNSLIGLIEIVDGELKGLGATIPARTAQALCLAPGVKVFEMDTAPVRKAARQLAELVVGASTPVSIGK